MLTIALVILLLLSIAITFCEIHVHHPDAQKVLTDGLKFLDSSLFVQALYIIILCDVRAFPTVSNIYTKYSNSTYPLPSSDKNSPEPHLSTQKLWDDMINAGALLNVLVAIIELIVITAFFYLVG